LKKKISTTSEFGGTATKNMSKTPTKDINNRTPQKVRKNNHDFSNKNKTPTHKTFTEIHQEFGSA
jgi:hypothetical protein